MTHENNRPTSGELAAAKRVAEIEVLFGSIKDILVATMERLDRPTPEMPPKMISKLSELQTAHLALIKAEEAFYEKIRKEGATDDTDFEGIRVEIGRQLDRIRDTLTTTDIH